MVGLGQLDLRQIFCSFQAQPERAVHTTIATQGVSFPTNRKKMETSDTREKRRASSLHFISESLRLNSLYLCQNRKWFGTDPENDDSVRLSGNSVINHVKNRVLLFHTQHATCLATTQVRAGRRSWQLDGNPSATGLVRHVRNYIRVTGHRQGGEVENLISGFSFEEYRYQISGNVPRFQHIQSMGYSVCVPGE